MTRTTTQFFVFGFLVLANLISCTAVPKPTGAIIVRLDDIQGMWGGQSLVVDADGNLFARKVFERKELRHHLKLSSEDFTALVDYIGKSGIQNYREVKRFGVPDEARPEITLSMPNQQKVTAVKWAGEKDPKFDMLYEKLLQLVDQATKSPAYKRKGYDYEAPYP